MFEPQRASGGWEGIMEQYGSMVYRPALARTHWKEDAEDVFQDVFLNQIRANKTYESEEHFKPSLIRSTINASHSLLRALSRRRTAIAAREDAAEKETRSGIPTSTGRLRASQRQTGR